MDKPENNNIITPEIIDALVSNPDAQKLFIDADQDECVIKGCDLHINCDAKVLKLKAILCNVYITNKVSDGMDDAWGPT